jgi:DNA-binding beta-propeller fold protein YncE
LKGFSDGIGILAQFNCPCGIKVDPNGNLIVADKDNNRIRLITSWGMVSTLAGTGEEGFANGDASLAKFNSPVGIALDSVGNVLVADRYNHQVRVITPERKVCTLVGTTKGGHKVLSARLAIFNR